MTNWEPLYLSTIAGLSTCIGAAVVFFQPKHDSDKTARSVPPQTMAFSLSLAGSVMVTVSVVSILPEVLKDDLFAEEGSYKMISLFSWDFFLRILFFGAGALLYFVLSSYLNVPEPDELLTKNSDLFDAVLGDNHPTHESIHMDLVAIKKNEFAESHETVDFLSKSESIIDEEDGNNKAQALRERKATTLKDNDIQLSPGENNGKIKFTMSAWTTGEDLESHEKKKAWRVAILLFISLLVHNVPEGLAVAASALESEKLGITVTIGIMIHNIPEGIAIAIPCLAARPNQPWLSFILASISGLAEPFGAFVALLFIGDVKGESSMEGAILNLENILSFVAGIMIMVAVWELFPEAKRHTHQTKKYFWYGTISGIIIMLLTEWYLP